MILRVPVRATKADLIRVAAENPVWKVELEPDGTLRMSPPTGLGSGRRNAWINVQLARWAECNGYVAFDSSTGFEIATDVVVSPDGALVRAERYAALTEDERETFASLVPNIALELVSKWDRPAELREKLLDLRRRGADYVVLVDPYRREVWTDGETPPEFPDLRGAFEL